MFKESRKRRIAVFFILILGMDMLTPLAGFALTSGPVQPETQQFQPAGATDLVDLFTGDFKYNIPLMDVGGYPVNLSYQAGSSMEDEGSWVGSGWTMNLPAINRTLRGLPDDFDGSASTPDLIEKEYTRKEFKKIGGQIVLKPSILAWEFGQASLKMNVYKDNYYGIGASVGASLGFQLAKSQKTGMTAGLDLGVNSDTRDGVSISPSFSLSQMYEMGEDVGKNSLSGGFTYNTRSGLKSIELGASYSGGEDLNNLKEVFSLSGVKYFGKTYSPQITTNTSNSGYTFSFDLGPSVFGGYIGVGGSGYTYNEKILKKKTKVAAYGYLNYSKGRKNLNSLLDFNMEKDGVFLTSAPAIPSPVATHDLFTATSQFGAQQFRPYYNGNYITFDQLHFNQSTNANAGITIGGGNVFKGGGRLDVTLGGSETKKWTKDNGYLVHTEPAFGQTPLDEPVYIKQVGEHTVAPTGTSPSDNFYTQIGKETERVNVNNKGTFIRKPISYSSLTGRNGTRQITTDFKRMARDKKVSGFQYLNGEQASVYGLDKTINGESRTTGYRKKHHISEITVTDKEGKRMVYGIPVYNISQEELSFSVSPPASQAMEQTRRQGIVQYDPTDNTLFNTKGRDRLFSRQITPSYATSFLLTAVLSPDYVDLTGDGISDDDLGTSVKFNYIKLPPASGDKQYQWRAPYGINKANYNEGFISDPKDDKASYVYGEKEIWYLQSIESKTMIAIFDNSDREDALGVAGVNGGQGTYKLKKLDKVTLYSKAEYLKTGASAIPVKVAHFEYDYSLYPDVPNNSGIAIDKHGDGINVNDPGNVNASKGKLTLKRVYFTFGTSTRGMSNPYDFEYDMIPVNSVASLPAISPTDTEFEDKYSERQSDRWGNYKKSFYNHVAGGLRMLNNSEFPYTLQENENTPYSEKELTNRLSSLWQLNKITTPTGSIIRAIYESDDYAYVQNKRAMQMCFVKGITTGNNAEGLITADKLVIQLPTTVVGTDEFKMKYLRQADGSLMDKMFYKVYTELNNDNHYEYVHGYAEIDYANTTAVGTTAYIALKKVKGYNPVTIAAWQMLRTDLPQYAYNNYDNSDVGNGAAAIRSIVQAILSLSELFTSFESRAKSNWFGNKVDLNKSMVRLNSPDYKKLGGGSRVRKIRISDEWENMAGGSNKTATYGQDYDYTTKNGAGDLISSGVAAYEPQIGNEENPFHEPVNFTEKVHWSSDRYHFIEKPFCESYFPSATVGYSKVTVTSTGNDAEGPGAAESTGYIENEFFTARDFPTIVDFLPLHQVNYENNVILKLFSATSVNRVVTSQGFKVELNDMHGKSKMVKVHNRSGDIISSTEYVYKEKNPLAEFRELNNEVQILNSNGSYSVKETGTEIDFTTAMRSSVNESVGVSTGAYTGGMILPIFIPIYIPYLSFIPTVSVTSDSYNSASAVKVIQRFGVLHKVISMKNGSRLESENLMWDGETGEVVLTRTQNAFDDFTYSFTYPAWMTNEGMGSSYKNQGALFTDMEIGTNGIVQNYEEYLFPGDELISTDLNIPRRAWVVKTSGNELRLVDMTGELIASGIFDYLLVRSGRRNLLNANAGSVISMLDPRVNGIISLGENAKILSSNSIVYKDEWSQPVNNIYSLQPPTTTVTLYANNAVLSGGNGSIPNSITCGDDIGTLKVGSYNNNGMGTLWYSDLDFQGINSIPSGATITSAYLMLYSSSTGFAPELGITNSHSLTSSNSDPDYTLRVARPAYLPDPNCLTPSFATYFFNSYLNFNVTSPYQDFSFSYATQLSALIADEQTWIRLFIIKPPGHIDDCLNSYASFCTPYESNISRRPKLVVTYTNPASAPCYDPVNQKVNPYYNGLLGNWRALSKYVYTVNREQKGVDLALKGSTNIRNSGYFSSYSPFWQFNTNGQLTNISSADTRWILSQKSVLFDQKGNEVESKDALEQYSSALYGYSESVPISVASNARRNEIAFDGFEDYDFSLQNLAVEQCPLNKHLDFKFIKPGNEWTNIGGKLVKDRSHSGRYSYELTSSFSITKSSGSANPPTSFYSFDEAGRYVLTSNEQAKGFSPINGKEYIVSFWVEDRSPATNTVQNLDVKINGISFPINNLSNTAGALVVPVVEGWKRVELSFTGTSDFTLELSPSGVVNIDDLRIFPKDGQMASYVYNDQNLRLMAQLDENNFASFYEYDEEGSLVRVKKETERGIMTLKENRQSVRRRN